MKFKIDMILASTNDHIIGNQQGSMDWSFKADFEHFKIRKWYHALIVGNKTFKHLPKIPNAEFIVISRTPEEQINETENSAKYYTVEAALAHIQKTQNLHKQYLVIGGAEIYEAFIPYVSQIFHTVIDGWSKDQTEGTLDNCVTLLPETVNTLHAAKLSNMYCGSNEVDRVTGKAYPLTFVFKEKDEA